MKAVITGASSGMGKYFAIELAKRGYDIIVVARREEKLQELCKLIKDTTKQNADYIKADLTDREATLKLAETIKKDEHIKLLINNAGIGYFSVAMRMDEARANQLVQLNMAALTSLTIEATKAFAKRNGGIIMNVASMAKYFDTMPANAPYVASKHYVDVFSRSVNFENKKLKNNVRIVSLRPGAINTEWASGASGSKASSAYDGIKFITPADKFAKKVIKLMLRGRNVITSGFGGYTSKIFSCLTRFTKNISYRIGTKAERK